jgi:hypothetical protein
VVGVAVLGAIVNAHLTTDFGASLDRRGTNGSLKDYILHLLETGGSGAAGVDIAHPPALIKPLVDEVTAAFRTGLHTALVVSALLIVIAAVLVAAVAKSGVTVDAEFS